MAAKREHAVKKVMNLNDLKGLPCFRPPGHSGTLNHRLAHRGNGAGNLAVWHGEIEPGGEAEEHVHEHMDQAFYVLEGECLFKLGDEEHRLGKGGFVFIPPQTPHRIVATGPRSLKLLIMMAPPPPETDDADQ